MQKPTDESEAGPGDPAETKPIQASYRVMLFRILEEDESIRLYRLVDLPFPPMPGLVIHFGNVAPFALVQYEYFIEEAYLTAVDRIWLNDGETIGGKVALYQSYGWELVD